jgi:hypothetical protein
VARSTTESAICEKSRFSFAGFRFAFFVVFFAMPNTGTLDLQKKLKTKLTHYQKAGG